MSQWLRLTGRTGLPRIPKWAIGVAVATPAAAAIQGALLLERYRRQHGHAPFPVSPSRGLVVVESTSFSEETPLRLLVIGDSLAAGVGTSQSGTPVLPESIAKGLSGASGGRAVHWTCIGTPGASASQIVQDIGTYEEPPASVLELKWIELQVTKRRAQEWWEHRKNQSEETRDEVKENKPDNRVKQWWSRVRKDVEELKDVLHVDQEEVALQRRLTRRKSILDPDMVAQYDIAVVLTGINDLKDTFLPFMMRGENASSTAETEPTGLKERLVGIIHALQSKMKLDLSKERDKDSSSMATSPHREQPPDSHRGPLVVFPAMPSSPLPLTHYPPLSWFLVPLIRMMDHNKKLLAQRFPGLVLYVDPPSSEDFRDIEAGKGELYASRRAEKVLLQVTDVTQRAQEKVKQLMSQHYENDSEEEVEEEDKPLVYSQNCREHQLIESKDTPGSTLLAADGIHPNDAGYDYWGRHIAAAIVKEWNKDNAR